eukprot:3253339-Pleurochrysis_carterae.AAC.1
MAMTCVDDASISMREQLSSNGRCNQCERESRIYLAVAYVLEKAAGPTPQIRVWYDKQLKSARLRPTTSGCDHTDCVRFARTRPLRQTLRPTSRQVETDLAPRNTARQPPSSQSCAASLHERPLRALVCAISVAAFALACACVCSPSSGRACSPSSGRGRAHERAVRVLHGRVPALERACVCMCVRVCACVRVHAGALACVPASVAASARAASEIA